MAKVAKAVAGQAKRVAQAGLKTRGRAARKAKTKEVKKKYNLRKVYTDEEKRVLKNLRSKKAYLKKKMDVMVKTMDEDQKITLSMLRPYMSKDMADSLAGTGDNPSDGGYFDPSNADDYYNRDFREWMIEKYDDNFMEELIDVYNALGNEDTAIKVEELDPLSKAAMNEKMDEYSKRIADIDRNINKVKTKAEERRHLAIAKELAKQNGYENAESLIEAIDRGHVVLNKLSKPEQAAITFVKSQFAKAIVGAVKEHGGLSEEGFSIAKSVINASVMSNPMEGLRVGIREMAVTKVVEKYGNDAGDMASSMIDLVTGKGSVGSLGVSIFAGIVNKTGFNKELMQERSQELIEAGKSDFDTENMKQFGADVVIDIAESVIMSGGNIYAAVPIALKKILFSAGGAAVRKVTEKPATKKVESKPKTAKATTQMSDEDVVNKFMS